MPPSQDQNPTTVGDAPRPDGDNLGWRPVLQVYGACVALGLCAFLIGLVYTQLWGAVFLLLFVLLGAYLAIPGALVAMGHPYGAFFRSERYVHPRLAGLVDVLVGLMYGALGGFLFVSMLFPLTLYEVLGVIWIPIVLGLVGSVPLLALNLFDRRRR